MMPLDLLLVLLQGIILVVGSIIFLVIQRTSLGGLPEAAQFYRWADTALVAALGGLLLVQATAEASPGHCCSGMQWVLLVQ